MRKQIWTRLRKPPELSPKKSQCITVGGFFLSAFCLTVLLLWVGTLNFSLQRLWYYFAHPLIFLLNYLPVVLLMGLLFALSNRVWLSFLLTALVTFLMVWVNFFKVRFRGEPFVATDLTLISEGAEAGAAFEYFFPKPLWMGILAILFCAYLLWRYARAKIIKKYWYTRFLAAGLCLGAALLSWFTVYSDELVYENFSVSPDEYSIFNPWKEPERAANRGFLYSFVHSLCDFFPQEPNGYDEQAMCERLAQYSTEPIAENERVNIVFNMLESFSDLSAFELDFTCDAYADWHALQAESYSGTLIVDTVGGGTINAERSVMTGFAFPHLDYDTDTNSYVHYFKALGYQTDGAHPGNAWFYNRENVNMRMGFDRYLFNGDYFDALDGGSFGADSVVLPALREIYEQETADGQPYFAFNVTYQNHSPYEEGCLLGGEYVAQGSLSNSAYYTLNNYLSGVAQTGEAVCAYVDAFREDETPVILIFFGDHKPTLGNANSVYEELGINVAGGTPDGCYNLYSTPYLIWANDAAKEILGDIFHGEGRTISPCYLMNELFALCGWEGPAWLQYQSECIDALPVIHRRSWYYVDGEMTTQLDAEREAVRYERNRMDYYCRTHFREISFSDAISQSSD